MLSYMWHSAGRILLERYLKLIILLHIDIKENFNPNINGVMEYVRTLS